MAQNKQRLARIIAPLAQPHVVKIVPVTGMVGDIQTNAVSNRVYFIHKENQVGILDGATNRIIGNMRVGEGATFLAVNAHTNRIYCTNFRDSTISAMNGRNNQVVTAITVGKHPFGIGIHAGSNRIYVANHSGSITIINGSTNRVLKTLHVGGSPALLVVNERKNRIYVTDVQSDSVHVIDGKTQTVVSTIKVGRNPIITPALNARTQRVYIANNLSRYLSVIHDGTNKKSVPIQLGRLQSELAINPFTNRIYVTSAQVEGPGKLYVLSGRSNNVLKRLTIPTFTYISVNPRTNHYFVSDSESNNVFVYSGRTDALIATLRTGTSAGKMALNPQTSRLYVGNNGAITVVHDRD